MEPEAFEHRLSVTLFLDSFLPSALFSNAAANVLSGRSLICKPVSSVKYLVKA